MMRPPTTSFRLLVGQCALRRHDSVFSSEDTCSDETIPFSRRWPRASARRLHFLVGEGAFRRQDSVFSSDDACSNEKIPFSRRTMRAPTRRLHFLVVHCVQSDSCDPLSAISPSNLCILTSR